MASGKEEESTAKGRGAFLFFLFFGLDAVEFPWWCTCTTEQSGGEAAEQSEERRRKERFVRWE